jgi:hypothetical protein
VLDPAKTFVETPCFQRVIAGALAFERFGVILFWVIDSNRSCTLKNNSTIPESEITEIQTLWRRILGWPSTRLGWWSIALALLYEIFMIINNAVFLRLPEEIPWRVLLLPVNGILLIVGLAAGIVGLIAVTRRRERSLLVWIAILIGLFTFIFLIG